MKQVVTLLAALVFGIVGAVGVSAVQPQEADAAAVEVRGCTGTQVSLSNAEKEMLDLHNRTRADRNLPKLCVHPALQRAAEAHSKDMIRRDYFSHDTKGQREDFAQRIKRYGYNYRVAGENIAWGAGSAGSPRQIFSEGRYNWMDSSGHRRNILDGRFREVGIGAYTGDFRYGGNTYRDTTMWTADFGDR
jgi:uncharacterized protein YkwD